VTGERVLKDGRAEKGEKSAGVPVKGERCEDFPKSRVRGRPPKRIKERLVEEPVILILSSDDEEIIQSDLASTSCHGLDPSLRATATEILGRTGRCGIKGRTHLLDQAGATGLLRPGTSGSSERGPPPSRVEDSSLRPIYGRWILAHWRPSSLRRFVKRTEAPHPSPWVAPFYDPVDHAHVHSATPLWGAHRAF
jgi:hypothetical protein